MSKPKKTAPGTWRIQLKVRGLRDAATFPTAREANEWGMKRTLELKAAATGGKAGAKLMGEAKAINDALKTLSATLPSLPRQIIGSE